MKKVLILLLLMGLGAVWIGALEFHASDHPNDDGSGIDLIWSSESAIDSIRIERMTGEEDFRTIAMLDSGRDFYLDTDAIRTGTQYEYRITTQDADGAVVEQAAAFATAKAQWFNTDKISLLIMALILSAAITFYILSARSGKDLYIRRISGLDSMEEAVGRATEMGKPILFVPGILDLDDMQTIAGLTILGKLAQRTAEYDTKLLVPVARSMVLSAARETVKESYMKAGRPDSFMPDSVFYLTDDQFGFVAGVDGIILREKPAAIFLMGAFYAESLILAETGFTSGAIQTAGTAMPSQLPFFVAACDYTLIGEELFAASAYLSKDPHQLGSLKGQDVGKAIFMIVLTVGIILEISGVHFLKNFLVAH